MTQSNVLVQSSAINKTRKWHDQSTVTQRTRQSSDNRSVCTDWHDCELSASLHVCTMHMSTSIVSQRTGRQFSSLDLSLHWLTVWMDWHRVSDLRPTDLARARAPSQMTTRSSVFCAQLSTYYFTNKSCPVAWCVRAFWDELKFARSMQPFKRSYIFPKKEKNVHNTIRT